MHMNLDPFLVNKIVSEVKSQGVFDHFRKESMADVDTKPAYQNLRQRVENNVTKFLSDQTWKPELNKNQLRERLRKHITDAGFLDTGVERIVDQVVNPKISTVFQPKIEEIAYKYLGIEKPLSKPAESVYYPTNGSLTVETDLMPNDLEAVSPDSDKVTSISESKEDLNDSGLNDSEDKNEEYESPPFEPLEGHELSPVKKDDSNHSEISGISGLTSQDSINSQRNLQVLKTSPCGRESALSQVSSDSRLSIVTNEEDYCKGARTQQGDVDMSEEAQMPKFNENSSTPSKEDLPPLHFDINKQEIKFEGTDRLEWRNDNSSKMDVDSGLSEAANIKIENDTESKKDIQIPTSSNSGTTNSYSDTQDSSLSKPDFFNTEYKHALSDQSCNSHSFKSLSDEANTSSKRTLDQNFELSSQITDELRVNLELDKNKSLLCESGLESEPRDDKHGKMKKISSRTSKSDREKSRSKASKNDRDIKKDKHSKLKREKERGNKSKRTDDHASAREKTTRRKSTDSSDGDKSKEIPKAASLEKVDGVKELTSSSNSSANSSSNNNSSGNSPINSVAKCNTLNGTKVKPVVLDNLLNDQKKNSSMELLIGNGVQQAFSNKNENTEEDDFKYFDISQAEQDQFNYLHSVLSEAIAMSKKRRRIVFAMNCDLTFIEALQDVGSSVINLPEVCNNNNTNNEDSKVQTNIPETFNISDVVTTTEKMNQEINAITVISDTLEPCMALSGTLLTNEDIKKTSTDYYSVAYQLYTDDKFHNAKDRALIIDCLGYNSSCKNVSPTPSDLSVSSKENDFIEKSKIQHLEGEGSVIECKKNNSAKHSNNNNNNNQKILEKKSHAAFKTTNQRYSSDDLYKPRPIILSQRAKRRAVDAECL